MRSKIDLHLLNDTLQIYDDGNLVMKGRHKNAQSHSKRKQ
jgi:hypothetical protein